MMEEPRCSTRHCRHLRGAYQPDDSELEEIPCCAAFPKGIPGEISYGTNLHEAPVAGDHGIQYEPEEEDAGSDSMPRLATDVERRMRFAIVAGHSEDSVRKALKL
jgi:hypothetical protein